MTKSKMAKKTHRPAKAAKRARPVKPIPKGYHTLTPGFCVRGAAQAIDFYKRAFGAAVARALAAGAKPIMPITDMFWGDRIGGVEDPYGQKWTLATHKEDVAPREMAKRAQAFYAQMGGPR